jgi:hypothetical protein
MTLVALVLVLTGCAARVPPAGSLDALAGSTRAIQAGMVEANDRFEDLQWQYLVFNAGTEDLRPGSFAIPEAQDVLSRLRKREAVLQVLSSYTAALRAFAAKDYASEIEEASLDLGASVKDLAAAAGAESEAWGVLATVVNEVGRGLAEHRRQEALKEVMARAQKPIEALAKLVPETNRNAALAMDTLLNDVLTGARRVRPPADSAARLAFDAEIGRLIVDVRAAKASLAAVDRAITRLPSAHHEVRRSLDDRKLSLDSLETLIADAKRINAFYQKAK